MRKGLRPPNSRMVYEQRPGCSSDRHDTRRAYDRYGCRCPAAKTLKRDDGQRYYHSAAGRARAAAQNAERQAARLPALLKRKAARSRLLADVAQRHGEGWSAAKIAADLGVTARQVQRYRALLREQDLLPPTPAERDEQRRRAAMARLTARTRIGAGR